RVGDRVPMPMTRITVDSLGAVPKDVTIEPEGFGSTLRKAIAGEDIRVGDLVLDKALRVEGNRDAAVAMLSRPARKAILGRADGQRVSVRDGRVVLEQEILVGSHALVAMVRSMVSLACELSVAPEAIAARPSAGSPTRPPSRS